MPPTARRLAALAFGIWGAPLAARTAWTLAARRRRAAPIGLAAAPKVLAVDDALWRGPFPTDEGLAALGERGVRMLVDLRAEADAADVAARAAAHGIDLVTIAIPNTRAPTPAQGRRFLDRVAAGPGPAFVCCAAGEGRTGTMVALHRRANGASWAAAVDEALGVGSLTFSQLAFVAAPDRRLPAVLAEWLLDRPTEPVIQPAGRLAGRAVGYAAGRLRASRGG